MNTGGLRVPEIGNPTFDEHLLRPPGSDICLYTERRTLDTAGASSISRELSTSGAEAGLVKTLIRPLAFACILSCAAHAQFVDVSPEAPLDTPVFQTIDFPGASATTAYGINNSGRIVGSYQTQNGAIYHAFLYYQGSIKRIDPPFPRGYAEAYGINDEGVIVGSDNHQDFQEGFFYKDGQYQHLPFEELSGAAGINDAGLIVGFYNPNCCKSSGYLYNPRNKRLLQIVYPGAVQTFADGINSSNVIVGIWSDSSSVIHGFIRENGVITSIDVPGAASTFSSSINSAGTIAGFYSDQSGTHHGFILRHGEFRTVDFPGASSTIVSGINDFGMIVGDYLDSNGVDHGFFGHL